jgi:Family of unknown function (DUF6788)
MTTKGLFSASASRTEHVQFFAKTLYKRPALVRHGVRCGKANCRCQRGELHRYAALYWRDLMGRQRRRYVRQADVPAVEQIITQRRMADRATRRQVADASAELRLMRRRLREFERSGDG